jgi:hypothetical protein
MPFFIKKYDLDKDFTKKPQKIDAILAYILALSIRLLQS